MYLVVTGQKPNTFEEPKWLIMGYSEVEAAEKEKLSERQLLDRVQKLEEKLQSQESLKEQVRKLENHVSKLLIHETTTESLNFSSEFNIPVVNVSSIEIDETPVLLERELHYPQEYKIIQKHIPQFTTSNKMSEIPEHDIERIQVVKSAPNNRRSNTQASGMRNSGILSEHKIKTIKIPSQFEHLKRLLHQENEKSELLEKQLGNSRNECDIMKKKLNCMGDELNEMKQCHLTLLDKAMSDSSFHKKNLQKLLAYIRNESQELKEKLTLQQFIQSGDYSMTKLLIDAEDDVNVADHAGFTLLHDVAGGGYVEMAEILLDAGADMNARATGGITPLHQAAMYGHLEMCQLLISKGCVVDQRSEFDSTPLHYAAENGHLEVVKFLIQCGANVNAEDSGGVTPYEDATRAGRISVAMWLAQNFSDDEQKVCFCGQPFN